jgi:hypothetical protein
MIKLFVAIPSSSSKIYTQTCKNLIELDRECQNEEIIMDVLFENNTSIVHHARNVLVTYFIDKTYYDYILFIDDDVEFNAKDIIKMIRTECKVIGGIYPYKRYNWENIVKYSNLNIEPEHIKYTGLNYTFTNPEDNIDFKVSDEPIEVEGVGTGCLLIHRSVIMEMIDKMKDVKYKLNEIEYYKIFDISIEDGKLISEDYWFCKRWKELGGKVNIMTSIKCAHWGNHRFG